MSDGLARTARGGRGERKDPLDAPTPPAPSGSRASLAAAAAGAEATARGLGGSGGARDGPPPGGSGYLQRASFRGGAGGAGRRGDGDERIDDRDRRGPAPRLLGHTASLVR